MYKSDVEYTRDKKSKMRWDKWGKPYRINKGKQVVSLSDFKKKSDSQSSTNDFSNCHSTVKNTLIIKMMLISSTVYFTI